LKEKGVRKKQGKVFKKFFGGNCFLARERGWGGGGGGPKPRQKKGEFGGFDRQGISMGGKDAKEPRLNRKGWTAAK